MKNSASRFFAAAGAALTCSALAFAHVDDPKMKDKLPRYEGPGYREGANAGRGAPQFNASNIQLKSWITLPEFGNHDSGNDSWGYVSPSGREYAIMGLSDGTGFVEVTDPANPTIINVISGPNSLWRDVKVYQNHAYAVSEGGSGIQVISMADIDNGVVALVNTITTGGVTSTHNVAIDTDSGYLYRCGGGSGVGLRIYNLANPASPAYVSDWPDRYVHDAQIVTIPDGQGGFREIAICCSGFGNGSTQTGVDILDVTNKTNILLIKRFFYSGDARYSHQAWFSPDKRYLYLDDELDEGDSVSTTTMYVLDMQDLANPVTTGVISNGNQAINHNLYTKDNYVFCANYRSGLRVFDATNPAAPFEAAYFDTFPESDSANFNGLWSNYPYFPSGTIIGSDIERGLFVWKLTLNQLAIGFPNGTPALFDPAGDSITVEITQLQGFLSAPSPTLHYNIGGGWVSVPLVARGGDLFDASIPSVPCGTIVNYYITAETTTDITVSSPSNAPVGFYSALAAYGSATAVADNFQTDMGWTATNLGASSGQWQRGVPVNDSTWAYDPQSDSDGSGMCWLTQNSNGNTDIDDGAVQLLSPALDFSSGNVVVSYDYYLYLTVADGVDMLKVEISSNDTAGPWTEVVRHTTDGGTSWRNYQIDNTALNTLGVTLTNNMRLRYTANDTGTASIVEAGLDAFRIDIIDCVPPDEPVLGDLNDDDLVNVFDLFVLLSGWGDCDDPCPPTCAADLDDSCGVDVFDLLILLSNWTH